MQNAIKRKITLNYIGIPLFLEGIEEIWSSFIQNSSIPRSAAFLLSMATTSKWLQYSFIIFEFNVNRKKTRMFDYLYSISQTFLMFWNRKMDRERISVQVSMFSCGGKWIVGLFRFDCQNTCSQFNRCFFAGYYWNPTFVLDWVLRWIESVYCANITEKYHGWIQINVLPTLSFSFI